MITCTFENGKKADHISLRHAVVDVLVLKGDKILLVKRTGSLLEGGKWGLIGGFAELNETLVQTCSREIFEETGYRITDITMMTIRDNPARPHEDRQNISFVFYCTALEKEGKADWESDAQKWFTFDALPDQKDIAFDHQKNIDLYLKYKAGHITFPVYNL